MFLKQISFDDQHKGDNLKTSQPLIRLKNIAKFQVYNSRLRRKITDTISNDDMRVLHNQLLLIKDAMKSIKEHSRLQLDSRSVICEDLRVKADEIINKIDLVVELGERNVSEEIILSLADEIFLAMGSGYDQRGERIAGRDYKIVYKKVEIKSGLKLYVRDVYDVPLDRVYIELKIANYVKSLQERRQEKSFSLLKLVKNYGDKVRIAAIEKKKVAIRNKEKKLNVQLMNYVNVFRLSMYGRNMQTMLDIYMNKMKSGKKVIYLENVQYLETLMKGFEDSMGKIENIAVNKQINLFKGQVDNLIQDIKTETIWLESEVELLSKIDQQTLIKLRNEQEARDEMTAGLKKVLFNIWNETILNKGKQASDYLAVVPSMNMEVASYEIPPTLEIGKFWNKIQFACENLTILLTQDVSRFAAMFMQLKDFIAMNNKEQDFKIEEFNKYIKKLMTMVTAKGESRAA